MLNEMLLYPHYKNTVPILYDGSVGISQRPSRLTSGQDRRYTHSTRLPKQLLSRLYHSNCSGRGGEQEKRVVTTAHDGENSSENDGEKHTTATPGSDNTMLPTATIIIVFSTHSPPASCRAGSGFSCGLILRIVFALALRRRSSSQTLSHPRLYVFTGEYPLHPCLRTLFG